MFFASFFLWKEKQRGGGKGEKRTAHRKEAVEDLCLCLVLNQAPRRGRSGRSCCCCGDRRPTRRRGQGGHAAGRGRGRRCGGRSDRMDNRRRGRRRQRRRKTAPMRGQHGRGRREPPRERTGADGHARPARRGVELEGHFRVFLDAREKKREMEKKRKKAVGLVERQISS